MKPSHLTVISGRVASLLPRRNMTIGLSNVSIDDTSPFNLSNGSFLVETKPQGQMHKFPSRSSSAHDGLEVPRGQGVRCLLTLYGHRTNRTQGIPLGDSCCAFLLSFEASWIHFENIYLLKYLLLKIQDEFLAT